MWLYLFECAVVAAAAAGVPWMKRAGEREWQRRRVLLLMEPMAKAFVEMQIALRDAFTPVLQRSMAALQELAQAFAREDVVSAELVRLTLGGRPARPELVHTIDEGETR